MSKLHEFFLEQYFNEQVLPKIWANEGENQLLEVVNQWNLYTIYAMLLNRIFDYIDRNYLQ